MKNLGKDSKRILLDEALKEIPSKAKKNNDGEKRTVAKQLNLDEENENLNETVSCIVKSLISPTFPKNEIKENKFIAPTSAIVSPVRAASPIISSSPLHNSPVLISPEENTLPIVSSKSFTSPIVLTKLHLILVHLYQVLVSLIKLKKT